jgi:hypothetical protein
MTKYLLLLMRCGFILTCATNAAAQSDEMSLTFSKSTWGIIAGIFVTAVLASLFVNYLSERIKPRVSKQLSWDLIISQVLSEVDPTFRDNVAVSYNDQSVKGLYSINCVLENTGNRAVKTEHSIPI